MDAATDATDDAWEALEPAASSPSKGERENKRVGDNVSSLRSNAHANGHDTSCQRSLKFS